MVPELRLKVLDGDIQSQEKLNEFQNERIKNIKLLLDYRKINLNSDLKISKYFFLSTPS